MLQTVSDLLFPAFLFLVILLSLLQKKDTVASFVKGAKDGISAIVSITPNILAIMVASAVFRYSGAMQFCLSYLTPVLKAIKVPPGIAEMILLRPVSGSGALALLSEVYQQFGPDSYEGLLASVIAASTETTLYTVMVYFGVTHVRKTKLPLAIGLLCDVAVLLLAVFVIRLWFG